MTRERINKLIGFGILIFLIGFILGSFWIEYFQWLIPVGTIMTFLGLFYFIKITDLVAEFTKDKHEDILTYFWNVLVLKIWTFIFILWMIITNLILLTKGII
jgi:hypothetical protein